jgi:BirA family biotin operon repressor/biotin-[acetyl-CoA-carboxylase] ligase
LDVDVIKAGLKTARLGAEVLVYDCTSSTNDVAWEYAGNREYDGLCVFAEEQTQGRGRRGNKWLSAKGQSVLCSILLLDFQLGAELLTLASAVATAEAVAKFTKSQARIKWPNDIIIAGKKTAGILVESRSNDGKNDYVIGVGINCRQDRDFFDKADLQMPATSIDIESKKAVDRNLLARELLLSFDRQLGIAVANSDSVLGRWQELSSLLGHHVVLRYDQQGFAGNCIGVDPAKGLILQLDGGGVRMFDAAHTTIVKQVSS